MICGPLYSKNLSLAHGKCIFLSLLSGLYKFGLENLEIKVKMYIMLSNYAVPHERAQAQ